MRIPGRLKDTTLGDVLGALFREQATGFLELIDRAGRTHRIELRKGEIFAVSSMEGPRLGEILELDPVETLPSREQDERGRLGERLIHEGVVDRAQLSSALRYQNLRRLEFLFSLEEASLRFRVPRPLEQDPTAPEPLAANDFLVGRPRFRSRDEPAQPQSQRKPTLTPGRLRALAVLGLDESATPDDVRAAFRQLAGKFHPDRHERLDPEERAKMFRKFAEISGAFHSLSA